MGWADCEINFDLTDVDGFYEHEKTTLIMLIQSGKQPKNKGGTTPPHIYQLAE